MKFRTNMCLITATLLTQYVLTKCADVSDSNTGPSTYTTEPFDHINNFDHLDHLDHDLGLEDDHESLEQFLTGSLRPSDLDKTNLNGKNKVIHSVKVIHHDGDSITKYVTTSHTDPAADSDLFDDVLMSPRQPSNAPSGAYTKITKKTIIKQSNSNENGFKEPSSVVLNTYSKNNSKEIETGNSMSESQTTSQIDHMTNNGMPLMSMRPIINSPDNLQNGMRTTITKIITTGSAANDLNGFANGKTNLDSMFSNKAVSTTSSSNSNSNYNDMVTDSSQIKPSGGNVNIQTTTTETINGFTGADNQGEFRERPEDGSFRRTKTTIVKQQHSNGRDNKFGGLDERDVEYVNGNTRPSENTVYQITPSRYQQLTTTSTTNTIDRNTPSNDTVSTMSSSNSNSDEHNIAFDKGSTAFSTNILSQTNPSSLTTTSITNAVDEKSTNGDKMFAGDLISGGPNNRLDKSMSLGNSVNGISSQMHSDEIALPSADMKKNSNNADSFRQTQTEIMGYRGASDESHIGGSNDTVKFNTDHEMSSLNNNASSNYMGSSNNANSMVGNPNMMAMDNAGSMSGGYSSSMASMGNNIKGNGYYVRRKKFNRKKCGRRGKKDKMRNKGKRPNRITVKSSSYEIVGGRRSIARKNRSAKPYKSQDYVQMSPESASFSKSYAGNPTVQQRRRLQCNCENANALNERSADNSEIDESNLNDIQMNGSSMQELFNQISFGLPGPPPYGRPRPRGPPPHGRPPWLGRSPRGPQRNEFINMNRPPGRSATYSRPDRATVLAGQTERTTYGQQNTSPNYISNVARGQYVRPEPLSGPPGPRIGPFDGSDPGVYQQSFDRYQTRPPYASSSYRAHGDTIDGADVGPERTGATANGDRENTVYTKTVKTTKTIVGNNPADIDVVRTESNYTY